MSAATAARWKRESELPFQRLDEETIVVDPRQRTVHLLNETRGAHLGAARGATVSG